MNLYSPHDILDLGKILGRYWFYSTDLSMYIGLLERKVEKARRVVSAIKNDLPIDDDSVVIVGEKRAYVAAQAKVTYYYALINKGLPWELPYELAKEEWGISRDEHRRMVTSALINLLYVPDDVIEEYRELLDKEIVVMSSKLRKKYGSKLGKGIFLYGGSKPADILFHKDVYIPKEIVKYLSGQAIKLTPSYHAREKTIREYYSKGVDVDAEEDLSKTITLNSEGIIEVGLDKAGNIVHILYREPFNDEWDIVYAIRYPEGYLKTFWLNKHTDVHETLDASIYEDNPRVWYRIKPTFDYLYLRR